VTRTNDTKICAVSDDKYNTSSYPGFFIPNVKFVSTFKVNPMFPDQKDFDIIACYRYKPMPSIDYSDFTLDS